jgi:bifunctional non-homologous end joining protein LigD
MPVRKRPPKDEPLRAYRAQRSADRTPEPFADEAAAAALTVAPAAEVRSSLVRLGALRRPIRATDVKMMLAETREGPFSAPGWIFELKYDGFRVVAGKEDGKPHLVYRKGSDATAIFPEVARALPALPFEGLVLDGEVVILDEEARPSFQRLQKRALLTRGADITRAAVDLPATYFAFDLLGFEDIDLRPLPLSERKGLLRQVLPRAGPLRFVDYIEEQGEAFYEEVGRMRLEGMVAKKADSPYRPGRSPDWLKVRVDRTGDFVVVGFTAPQGGRVGFGALHLATYERGNLVYAGRVGTGFNDDQLQKLRAELEQDRRLTPPCTGPLPPDKATVWVEPRRVVEVRYKEWTGEGLLRQPVFQRFRDDKPIEECVREGQGGMSEPLPPPIVSNEPAPERKVPFSNLDKIFWPQEGYTKGDLIAFYRAVSPWLLPYLKDRPLVLARYPDGITGKNFFQKDAPDFVPGRVRLERIWSEHAQREIDYFIADDEETLLYIINLGTIPLHVWASRIADITHPDWCILDLDPKEAPFADVVQVAQAIHDLAEEMETPSFVKTSGSTGIHVLVPLGGQCTFEQGRTLGELMARVVAERRPEIATTIRLPASRGGRVYVDFLQNGHGKLLAAPFSARPVPGAKVSTPLAWSEVKAGLDPARFTIRTMPERLRALKEDPLRGLLSEKPDLGRALARLTGLIKG